MNEELKENPATELNEITAPETIAEPAPTKAIAPKSKMMPILLALNGIMLIGLIVLFFLYSKKNSDSTVAGAINKSQSGMVSLAYVNNDSIMSNYELVKILRTELEAKAKRLEGEVAAKQRALEKDAAYFQQQIDKKTLSEQSAQEIYMQLQQEQQKVYELRDRYAAELSKSEMDMNIALLDSVMNFLDRYNKKYKFDYILGFTKGGNILYANDTLDITKSVIEELNTEYRSKHSSK